MALPQEYPRAAGVFPGCRQRDWRVASVAFLRGDERLATVGAATDHAAGHLVLGASLGRRTHQGTPAPRRLDWVRFGRYSLGFTGFRFWSLVYIGVRET